MHPVALLAVCDGWMSCKVGTCRGGQLRNSSSRKSSSKTLISACWLHACCHLTRCEAVHLPVLLGLQLPSDRGL